MGRPRKFKTPEQMQKAIDAYFNRYKKNPTICGLALALGFCSRLSLIQYEGYSKEFFATIKKAKLRVEAAYERDLRKKSQQAGIIFALKNFKWQDSQQHELGGLDGQPIAVEVVKFGPNGQKKGKGGNGSE